MAHLNRVFVPVFLAFIACTPPVYTPQCVTDADCGVDLVCDHAMCIAQPDGACRMEETRPCGPPAVGLCHLGTQHCSDRKFTTTCEGQVTPVPEVCNNLDDDCDGVVDNGVTTAFYPDLDGDGFGSSTAVKRVECTPPAGFVTNNTDCNDAVGAVHPGAAEVCDNANLDEDCSGTANDGCGCANVGMTQACCSNRGTQLCESHASGATLSVCSVSATAELCNGIDDDCDGTTDEQYALASTDGGSVTTDGGVFALDGGCSVGVGACARNGAAACTSGALGCNVTPGSPTTETCNGLDDDCDGQTDEVDPGLCPASGQTCVAGSCTCPAGQMVCGTSCQALNTGCSTGTGACSRQGTMICSNGAATCSAVAGTPSTEICNNIDDDCDGQIDEISPSLCAATGQSCNTGACSCPSGQTVCGSSCQPLGGTCSPGLGACQRTGSLVCMGGGVGCSVTAAAPVAETCDGIDNDCNGTIDNGVTITCYPDGDNDGYATNTTSTQQCPAAGRAAFGNCPAGFVAPSSSLGIDCDPANATLFRTASTRADADGDAFCTGTTASQCVGANAPAGRRFVASCAATDDCNDGSATLFKTYSVRNDADNDTFCVGGAFTQCAGNAPLAGTRLVTTCASSDDCRDFNQYATTVCSLPAGFGTEFHLMSCGIGLPGTTDTFVSTVTFCPTGFSLGNVRTEKRSGAGVCTANNPNSLHQTCMGFDASDCRIIGDCTAD